MGNTKATAESGTNVSVFQQKHQNDSAKATRTETHKKVFHIKLPSWLLKINM